MCGIVAYIGEREACPILLSGLKRLEYRGYDSAGIALINNHQIHVYKTKGRVQDLEKKLQEINTHAHSGMGHTRWATHGEPNDVNAHPHTSMNGKFCLIHNGIIENYMVLKEKLTRRGYSFKSETDSEVLVNLIEYIYLKGGIDAETAVRLALTKVVGAYGLVIMCSDEQDKLITTRKGSPLVIGVGNREYFAASDATPIIEYTKNVIYLNDDDMAVLRKDGLTLKTRNNDMLAPDIQQVDLDIEKIEKGGFPHFMLKEIFEQVYSIRDTIRGRVNLEASEIFLGGISEMLPKLLQADRIIIVGCGTSWHAGLVGEYLLEELAGIPVEVEYASEFRYRNPIIREKDIVLAISQSGETADTLAAVELAKSCGAFIYGICNAVGSSIPRATHTGSYIHVGPEIGVASTKAFTGQVTVLTMLALTLAKEKKTMDEGQYLAIVKELGHIPDKMEEVLKLNDRIAELSKIFTYAHNFIYLGRGYSYPVALEGALKLKEISYIHAEGYPAAEMKHGPIALVDTEMPVVVIATRNGLYEKVLSNIQEIKARKGRVIAIVTKGDTVISKIADTCIELPETMECLDPLITTVPLQLLAYHIAVCKGMDVDQPRNLAKSVTVE